MHRPSSTMSVVAVLAAVCLTACGANKRAAAAPPATTVTVLNGGTSPAPATGSPPRAGKPVARALATGRHDHAGELCSGRTEQRYTAEHMVCIVGRLQTQSRGASASAHKRARHNRY